MFSVGRFAFPYIITTIELHFIRYFVGMLTMAKSVSYQIRLEEGEKEQAFSVLRELGISPAQAFRLFLRQVVETRSIPFPIRQATERCPLGHDHTPNKETTEYLLKPDSEKGYTPFSFAD